MTSNLCVYVKRRTGSLWIGAYGWMRIHRETLSVVWAPWAMTVIWAAIDSEKSPLCLSVSLWMLLVCPPTVNLSLTVMSKESDPSSPLTLPLPVITHPIIYTSIHLSIPPSLLPPGFKCFSLHFHRAPPSTPLHSGRHRNGWFRKGGRVSQSSCCSAPCSAFTVHFCFCAAFMALICWQFRWLSQMLYNCVSYTKSVCSVLSEDVFSILSCIAIHCQFFSNNASQGGSLLLDDKSPEVVDLF